MSSDAIDVSFTEEGSSLAVRDEKTAIATDRPQSADSMLEKLHEWEKFKSLAVRPEAWVQIPGIPGKYLPADEVYRIAPAVGVKWEIVSLDENGQKGVRCQMVDFLTYEKKKITKRFKEKNGEWKEKEMEVSDLSKPIVSKTMRYTVTLRAYDGFGRYVDVVGSFDASEMPKSDYAARQQALTRARRRSTLILIGGVDRDVAEEMRAGMRHARDTKTEQGRAVPSSQQLVKRAIETGVAKDGETFCAWCRDVVGIPEAGHGWKPTPDQKRAIMAALEKGPKAAPAVDEEDDPEKKENLRIAMLAAARERCITDQLRHEISKQRYGKQSSYDLTAWQLGDLGAHFRGEVA